VWAATVTVTPPLSSTPSQHDNGMFQPNFLSAGFLRPS
jgi:hypothetical protein